MAAGAPKADEVTVQTDGSSPEYDHGVDHPPPPPSQPSRIPKPVAAADNALPNLTHTPSHARSLPTASPAGSDLQEAQGLQKGTPLSEGDKVTVTADYQNIDDSIKGPLTPGLVGLIIQDDESSKPFQVQYGDQKWWYVAEALRRVH